VAAKRPCELAAAAAEHDMRDDQRRQAKPGRDVDVGDNDAQYVRPGVVEREGGDDEDRVDRHHDAAGRPIAAGAPRALQVQRHQRAE
jgi:hypothetical protein